MGRGATCFQHLGYLNTLKNPYLKHCILQPLLHSDCMRLSCVSAPLPHTHHYVFAALICLILIC